MRTYAKAALLLFSVMLVPVVAQGADTLVVAGDNCFKPGVAKSWTGSGSTVTFVLNDGADGNQIAGFLRERLAQAKVDFADGKLTISGVPMQALLEQLSTLSLSGEADPLAALAGLGGAGGAAGDGPEGGGSIRATNHTALPAAAMAGAGGGGAAATPATPATPAGNTAAAGAASQDSNERFDADVLEIKKGDFPKVTLKLKVRRGAMAGPLKAKLASGKTFDAAVVIAATGAALDLKSAEQQRNLGAYYLRRGDRVTVHAIEPEAGVFAVDWIERK